ncbi:hypothetical protein DL95DRAFT_469153 [Leptodontidium sp. 2 PMI_412]|nr:hypothetical protein DL95DRAFT_469153 [Leptodontidium sp. 2 PMI_412]
MEEKLDALRAAFKAYIAAGYTGIVEMAMDENALEALQELQRRDGQFTIRLAAYWIIAPSETEEENLKQVHRAIELQKQFNAATSLTFRIVGIKTAKMLDPVVRTADAAGLQCALHAISDSAIKLAINILEKNSRPGRRHRIEHLELASLEDAKRLGQLGIIASV